MHNYHSAVNSFPWGDGPWWIEWSAHTLLLPYIEQGPIYNAINFADTQPFGQTPMPINNPVNTTAVYRVISGFLCPSDQDRLTDPNGHNNYMANSGSAPNCDYGGNAWTPSWNGPAAGPFIYSSNGVDTGPPGFRWQLRQHRRHHRRDQQHSRLQRTGQGDRRRISPTPPPRSIREFRPRRSRRPPAVDNSLEGTPQAYYNICKVTPPVPVGANQDAANFSDDNISGAMWVSGQPALTRYIHVMPPNTWSCRSRTSDRP